MVRQAAEGGVRALANRLRAAGLLDGVGRPPGLKLMIQVRDARTDDDPLPEVEGVTVIRYLGPRRVRKK